MSTGTIRTTVSLPEDLLLRADRAVERGAARSRNALLADALRHEVESLERCRVDEAFAGMAEDEEYLREAEGTSEQFAASDREAVKSYDGFD